MKWGILMDFSVDADHSEIISILEMLLEYARDYKFRDVKITIYEEEE